jgi:hypothetical protein
MKNALTVITTFNEAIWNNYAFKSIPTWFEKFDHKINFHFYTEGFCPIDDPRILYLDNSTQKLDFVDRNRSLNRIPNKSVPSPGRKWDSYCHKVFAQCESSKILDNRYMMFVDADVALLKNFSVKEFESFLENHFCGYVGREGLLTETGLIMYDLSKDKSVDFFDEFEKIYTEDQLFELESWCDCSAFDHARSKSHLSFKNLSGRYAKFLDPISVSDLGNYFDHWMGKLSKLRGYSKHRKFRGKV